MIMGRVGLVVLALVAVGVLSTTALRTPPQAGAARGPWCGASTAFDWICPRRGQTFVEQELLPRRRATVAAEQKAITTAPRSEARLSFADQANCTLFESTRIYTRPEQGRSQTLFAQPWGESECNSLRAGSSVSVLCGSIEIRCPVKVKMKEGKYLTRYSAQDTASTSSGSVSRRRSTLVACSGGYIRVRVEIEGGFAEAAGGASGNFRYVVVVEEVTTTTESEGAVETETSLEVEFDGVLRGPGACAEDRPPA